MGTHFALNTMEGALPMILDEVDQLIDLGLFQSFTSMVGIGIHLRLQKLGVGCVILNPG